MTESLRHKTVFGLIWAGLQKFGTVSISFLSNIVLARLLTPADFGCIGMLTVFIAVCNSIVVCGFGSALIQKSNPTEEDYSTVFYWNLGAGVQMYALLFLSAPLIADFYKIEALAKILRVQGIILIINAFTIVQFNILQKQMQFKKIAAVNISSALVSVTVGIIYAGLGGGVWALVAQQIVMSACNVIILFFIHSWRPLLSFSVSSFKSLFKFGSYIFLSSLTNTISDNFGPMIVGRIFSANILGFYTQAIKIELITSKTLSEVLSQVSYPLFVKVNSDYTRLKNILRQYCLGTLAVVMPLMFCISIASESVVYLLYGAKWTASAPILRIICFGGIFICLQRPTFVILAAIGKSRDLFIWTIIKRGSGICIILAGAFFYGLTGILYAMVTTSAVIWLCNVWLVRRFTGYPLLHQLRDLLPVTIPCVSLFAVVHTLQHFNLLGIYEPVYCGVYVAAYALLIAFLPNKSIRELRANITAVIRKNSSVK